MTNTPSTRLLARVAAVLHNPAAHGHPDLPPIRRCRVRFEGYQGQADLKTLPPVLTWASGRERARRLIAVFWLESPGLALDPEAGPQRHRVFDPQGIWRPGFHHREAGRRDRQPRPPVALSRRDLAAVFGHLEDPWKLAAQLMFGSGLRRMQCLRLRVKDLDFDQGTHTVHDGKRGKHCGVPLPRALEERIRNHLAKAREKHLQDLAVGLGGTHLPEALKRKYPRAESPHKFLLFPFFVLARLSSATQKRQP